MVKKNINNIIENIANNILKEYSSILSLKYSTWDIYNVNKYGYMYDNTYIECGNMQIIIGNLINKPDEFAFYIEYAEFTFNDYLDIINNPIKISYLPEKYGKKEILNITDYSYIIAKLKEIHFWSDDDDFVKVICLLSFLVAHEFGHALDSVVNSRDVIYCNKAELEERQKHLNVPVEDSYEDSDFLWSFTKMSLNARKIACIKEFNAKKEVSKDCLYKEINDIAKEYRENRHEKIPDLFAIEILKKFESIDDLIKD